MKFCNLDYCKATVHNLSYVSVNNLGMFKQQFAATQVKLPLVEILFESFDRMIEAKQKWEKERASLEEGNILLMVPPILAHFKKVIEAVSEANWEDSSDKNRAAKLELEGVVASIQTVVMLNLPKEQKKEKVESWTKALKGQVLQLEKEDQLKLDSLFSSNDL